MTVAAIEAEAEAAWATLRLRFVLFEISVYNFFGFDLLMRRSVVAAPLSLCALVG